MREEPASGRRSSTGPQISTKPPSFFLKIAGLILRLYPDARKIIEIGVGRSPYTALQLRSILKDAEIIVTDADPEAIRGLAHRGVKALVDDIFHPDLRIYEGADLIYSIRPPFELIPKIAELGRRVGAAVLIIPLSEDAHLSELSGWRRIREDGIIAYLLEAGGSGRA